MAWDDSNGTGTAVVEDPEELLRRRLAQMPPAPPLPQTTSVDALAHNPQNLMMPAAPMPNNVPTGGASSVPRSFQMPAAPALDPRMAAAAPPGIPRMPPAPMPDAQAAAPGQLSAATNHSLPKMPPAPMPGATTATSDPFKMPPAPPNRAQEYADLLKQEPQRDQFQAEKMPMWKKALGLISAAAGGFGSRDETTFKLAQQVLGAPQAAADQKYNDAESAWKNKVGAVGTEAGLDEKGAQTREANARAGSLENPPPKPDKEVSLAQEHADAVTAAIKAGKDPATDPTVQQYAKAIQSLQKPTAEKPEPAVEDDRKYQSIVEKQMLKQPLSAEDRAWKAAYEKRKTLVGNSSATIRVEGMTNAMNQTKIMNVIRNGQLMAIHPEEMQQGDVMAGASAAEHAMSKEAQFGEIHSAIDKGREAINKLDQPLSAEQIGKLTLAMKHTSDPGVWRTELESFLGTQRLTPSQQDLVVWLGQLNERALSLRNVAGMGQGSDSMRAAIQATLPSIKSGNKEMMLKQLAAFENQTTLLEKGVPKMPGGQVGGKSYTQADVDDAAKRYGMTPAQIEQGFKAKGWNKQ